jgi:ATP-binding cassette subfamily F protein uup
VAALSGGERNRLLLARLFARPANLLVLDEPTNDLDIESLELLEATLQGYSGTLLLVSHDRTFLDNVVTQTLVAQSTPGDEGRWKEYVGGYSDWLAQRSGHDDRSDVSPPRGDSRAAEPAPRTAPPRSPKSSRLSFKEQRELDALPTELEALEHEQTALTARMSEPAYYKQDAAIIRNDRQRAQEIEHLLAAKFERWGELDARKSA